MIPAPKGIISVLIFGNDDFPVLPAPFQCMVHTTLKGADDYITKVGVDVIFVGVTDAEPSVIANLAALTKLSPSSSQVTLVKDFAEGELALANGAAHCILRDRLTVESAVETARFVIARTRYLKHGGGNSLYTYSDLAAIARVLSHDIRNSLSGIMLSLEPIRQACGANEEAKAYIDILDRSSTKLNQVVNRFSAATGNIALKIAQENFNDLVRHSVATLPSAMLKDVQLVEEYAEREGVSSFDRERIPQVVTNLVSNAAEALEGRPNGEIRVSTLIDDTSATLTVRDNGHGIDFTTLQNVFRPFFTTRPGKAGLGLSLAYSIVNAHGGTIRIDSGNGHGTTVICRFPIRK